MPSPLNMIRVTEYQDGTIHYLNPERIEQMQEVYGHYWKTAIALIGAPIGDRWLRVRESIEDVQKQMTRNGNSND